MAPKFDDVLNDLVQSGRLEADAVEEIKQASGIRRELEESRKEATDLKTTVQKFRESAIKAQLAKHDVKLSPKALSLPDDLDVADEEAFKDWLIEAGAIEDTKQTEIDTELGKHERVASASQTGQTSQATGAITPTVASEWAPDKWMRFKQQHPEAAEQLMQGQEVHGIAF